MSSQPEPSPDPADVRARDEAVTSSLVSVFVASRDSKAALDALELRTLATAAALVDEQRSRLASRESRKTDLPVRTMVAELATAALVSERTIQRLLDESADLCERFPAAVDALAEARISRAHVSVIHDAGHSIEDADARHEYTTAAIARAETMTPGRLRPIVDTLAARLHPRSIEERHVEAREKRMVRVIDTVDAMADLIVCGPAVLIHGIHDRLTELAHAIIDARPVEAAAPSELGEPAGPGPGGSDIETPESGDDTRDTRTIDQLRVDVLCDLLLTGTAETCSDGEGIDAIRATVQITVPVLTAAGAGAEPALLAGYGPIDPDTARRLAGNAAGWERVMTSPVTGCVVAVDRYRPSRRMKRLLRARDERCRFPGCRQKVWRCDIDHTIDAAHGGATDCGNLAHLCRRHHVLKHNSRWTVRQRDAGVLEWTSPTGRVYVDTPEPTLRFLPGPESPSLRDPATWGAFPDSGDPPWGRTGSPTAA